MSFIPDLKSSKIDNAPICVENDMCRVDIFLLQQNYWMMFILLTLRKKRFRNDFWN